MKFDEMVAAQVGLPPVPEERIDGGMGPLLALLASAGSTPRAGAGILDLGCGIGRGVGALLERGFDAHGTDLFEYWGAHARWYWGTADPIAATDRLSVAKAEPYRLPYADGRFDHVVSSEVLEHVADRPAVFAEIRRVLKPGGTSAHIFPSRWAPLIEGHVGLPFPLLCKSRSYLKLAALIGLRGPRQKGLGRLEAYRLSAAQMATTHYPSRRRLLHEAQAQGLLARFATADYVGAAGTGWTRLHGRLARFGAEGLVTIAGRVVLGHMLVLRRP
jgi:SAM-dependent methyltransferase